MTFNALIALLNPRTRMHFHIFRSFKANKKLRKIHANGFAGILNVMELYVFITKNPPQFIQ